MTERFISGVDIHTGEIDAWVILPPLPSKMKGSRPPVAPKVNHVEKKHIKRDGKDKAGGKISKTTQEKLNNIDEIYP